MYNFCKKIFFIILMYTFIGHTPGFAESITITSAPKEVKQYELFKLSATLPYFKENPNDSLGVQLEMVITAPSGKTVTLSGFCLENQNWLNKSSWEVRYTPEEEGRYQYSLKLESKALKSTTQIYSFDSLKGGGDGFLRRSKNNPHYLVSSSGRPFFGIGHNIAWVQEDHISIFDRYLTSLKRCGGNLTRVWLSSWSFPIEWGALGEYSQTSSAKIDRLVKLMEERGVYFLLCIDTYGNLMEEEGYWGENKWHLNPYNKVNGGPCRRPEEFFTNKEAKRLYKNRLRYIISRWSYSPSIIAFELWNEYNAPAEWVEEMASFIRSINPHGQFITTSFGYPFGEVPDESEVWDLNDVSMVTVHLYGNATENSMVPLIEQKSKEPASRYNKPFIIAECGIDAQRDDKYYDPKGYGTALHNSLWSSGLSKSFGTAMSWWWDTYIRPRDLYYHYNALAKFLHGVDWDSKKVEYAEIGPMMLNMEEGAKLSYRNAVIKTEDKWAKLYNNTFTVLDNGELDGVGQPNRFLHGEKEKDKRINHIFHVDYPNDGKFIIRIGTVSQGAHLHVFLDGEQVAAKRFFAGPGDGPWARSLYLRKWEVYQCVYDKDFAIEVPKGKHTITLYNTGKDWLGIKTITLTDYVYDNQANARCIGLVVGDQMLFWVQNKGFNWKDTFYEIEPEPVKNAYFQVKVAEEGRHIVEWWDTFKGEVVSTEGIMSKGGELRVEIPQFSKDIACKIKKVR